ncbi:neutral/alkaline non-lysosomal ceramidase N-terminal domain-containing protein [Membranihabitans maritimus]|uniref:neutral/alkaline non-lysosomal ceramidase N-terminal domain-containing protein n=1 Tax=Membranihabitans maritimus TaxID=2904244 RepID=UPI001F485461|nr:neutral/alkaline non-lysosomal ceramidase N-terminal domain-containing protein [Membranihabitans maritimus]
MPLTLLSNQFYIILLLTIFCPAIAIGESGDEMLWKAGTARINITPDESIWMGGYASRNHPSEGIRQDVWIKAVALEDRSGRKGVLVAMDLVLITKKISDRIRNQIKNQYGLDKEQIILNVSHTHSGPELNYQEWNMDDKEREKVRSFARELESKTVQLVGKALNDLKPAQLYAGNGLTRFQVNRRNNKEHELKSYSELKGPNDYAVPVIKIMDKNNIKAIVFGYACHATVLSDYLISGDYPGYAQKVLEEKYPGTTALFFQGAGGDQNPLPRREEGLAEQYGLELSAAVDRVLKREMRPLSSELVFSYSEIEIGLQKEPLSRKELESIVRDDSYPSYQKQRVRIVLNKMNGGVKFPPHYPYPVEVWKVGEQAIFALGGELLVGYAIELKRIFGDDIFVFGYCNDVMGYIPTVEVLREGGYEANRAPYLKMYSWEPNIEYLIIKESKILAKKVGVEMQ